MSFLPFNSPSYDFNLPNATEYSYEGGLNTSTPTWDYKFGSGDYSIPVSSEFTDFNIPETSFEDAYIWAKDAFPDLPEDALMEMAKKMLGTGAQLVGNNMASKSVDKLIKEYMDKIEETSPISEEQRTRLGELGMSAAEREYLSDRQLGQYMQEFDAMGANAADQAYLLNQLYTDPMSNPIMQSVARIAGENAARKSAAPNARGINSGSFQAEQQDALLAALGQNYANIANPMNSTLQSLYAAQMNPMKAIDTLSGASSRNVDSASKLINAGSGTQQALGNFITNQAFPTALAYDPTRMGMSTMGARAGGSSADSGDAFLSSALGAAGTAIGGPIGGAIGGLLGDLF